MKTEVRNEFILEAHKSACSEWKLKIEKECPELFENKLEVGKWYKDTYKGREKNIVFITEIDKEKHTYGYGFMYEKFTNTQEKNKNGKCLYNSVASNFLIKATEEEVKEALIKEAEKRGFKSGLKIKPLWDTPHSFWNLSGNKFEFLFKDNSLFLSSCIFYNGKWSEIISNPIEEKINDLQKQIDELKKQL